MVTRRKFLKGLFFVTGSIALSSLFRIGAVMGEPLKIEPIVHSDEEWRKLLTTEQYHVLRHEGTESPSSSPLNGEHRRGTFLCAACKLPLFLSAYKFDSGTGWPSFFQTIPGHIETQTDKSLALIRTEYHCARCGGHQGHVFDDGPQPTGLRYCNNGIALQFVPEKS